MSYNLTVTTAPATEPVTLTEAKAHVRVDGTADDTYLTTLITVARRMAEAHLNRALISQTLTAQFSRFPRWGADLLLTRPPLISDTSVAYVDTDGTPQTDLSPATTYDVDITSEPGRIALTFGGSWPTARDEHMPVTIVYVAGWASASAVPETIKQAILLAIGQWYCQREVTGQMTKQLEFGWNSMLDAESFAPDFITYDPIGATS